MSIYLLNILYILFGLFFITVIVAACGLVIVEFIIPLYDKFMDWKEE